MRPAANTSVRATGQDEPSKTRLRYSPRHALATNMFSISDGSSRRWTHCEYPCSPTGVATSKTLGTAERHW
eukprot:7375875-Prymnesium_polylepis.2